MRKLEFTVGLIATLMISSITVGVSAQEAEYYTWVDENGITNYAEKSPQGYDARHITPRSRAEQRFGYARQSEQTQSVATTTSVTGQDAEEDALVEAAEQDSADIDDYIAQEKARIDGEIARAKTSNCNIGKLNLAQLTNYNRIKVEGDDGEIRVLSNEEKDRRINAARQTIAENCNG